jgi:hypothetical protein
METESTEETIIEAETGPNDAVIELEGLSVEDDFAPGAADVTEPEPPAPPTKELIYMAASPLVDIFLPAWKVSEDEKRAVAGAWGDLIDKYFPDVEMGVELTAIIVTGMVIVPRLGMDRKEPEEATGPADNGD